MRCPHGFVGLGCSFPDACDDGGCMETAVATQRAAAAAHPDFPLRSDPIRFLREVRLPLGNVHGQVLPSLLSFSFPCLQCFAWHETSLSFYRAWVSTGFTAASLADRPSGSPPPPNSFHFIAEDVAFFK